MTARYEVRCEYACSICNIKWLEELFYHRPLGTQQMEPPRPSSWHQIGSSWVCDKCLKDILQCIDFLKENI